MATTMIPKGSWILVTGANGYVASHIVRQFLNRGYKVRGTVRDLSKTAWVTDELFHEEAQLGNIDLVQVPDLGADKAFDDVVRGVSAVIHVATVSNLDPDPHNVIAKDVSGMKSLLQTAAMEPSVRRFVYTSSFVAAAMPIPGLEIPIGPDTFNDAAVTMAWAPPPYDSNKGMIVYMASKTEAERTLWKFVSEEAPDFEVNTVSPLMVLGTPLHKSHLRVGGTPSWLNGLFFGSPGFLADIPANIYTNVKDVAALHVAAALDPDVRGQRIQAWAVRFNWNDVLAIMRRLYPKRQFIEDMTGMGKMLHTTDTAFGETLLKKWTGHGWTSLEDGVRETLDVLIET